MNPYHFQNVSYFTQILPVIASIFYSRHLSGSSMVFSYYLVISLVSTALNTYLAVHKIHNLWALNLFMPIQFGMLAYYLSFYVGSSLRRAVIWSIPSFLFLWLINFLLLESIFTFSTYAKPLECAFLTVIASVVLFTNYRRELIPVWSNPPFWIATGIMLYFSSIAVLFSMSASLLKVSSETLRIVFSTQAVIAILANFSYISGILCLRRQAKYSGQPL